MAVRPVGQLVEERCRRGTRRLSRREQLNRVPLQYIAASSWPTWIPPTRGHSPCEYRGAPATLCDRHPELPPPPAFVGSPKQGAPPQRHDYATALPPDPVRPAEHRRPRRGAQRTRPGADAARFCPPPRAKLRGEPPAPPSFGKRTLKRCVCRRSGGTGSGGTPDKCGGKIVSTCKELRVRSKSRRGTEGMYRRVVPDRGDFPFQREHTTELCCVKSIYEYIRANGCSSKNRCAASYVGDFGG